MTAVDLNGVWKLDRSENFEEFLNKMGVSWMKRKLINTFGNNISVTINQSGEDFVITTKTPKDSNESKFKVGQPFKGTNKLTGKAFEMMAEFEAGKLVVAPVSGKDNPTITREIDVVNDEMVQTMDMDGVVTKRYFKRE
ncbi:fatty acid-binding protein, intestinal-like [Anneissia japonica]|uniref:fatty acid-binding protein, intestinal-like n=1 Tax=Anneissia japonica TaxID=1529436 RepID=UPI0014256C04|nr:fatty acid-binding protein, intestinal-like [Anneissia japonica]